MRHGSESSASAAGGEQIGVGRDLISVIIVNFNAGDYLRAAVDSVIAQDGIRAEIIVVDNASTDGSIAHLRDGLGNTDQFRLIEIDSNIGFARACNVGIQAAQGRTLLLVNPDCRLFPGAVATLRDALDADPEIGMVGPRIINPDGSEQRGARRDIPNPWQIFCVVLQLHRLMPNHPRFRGFNRHGEPLPDKPTEVQAVSGACMMVRRETVSAAGTLDSDYFLHFEDLDWCLRINAAGWRIVFVPEAVVEHTQGVCGARTPFRVEFHKHKSLIRFLQKHFAQFYPSSFMALVAVLVMVRFAVLVPRLAWRRISGRGRLSIVAARERSGQT